MRPLDYAPAPGRIGLYAWDFVAESPQELPSPMSTTVIQRFGASACNDAYTQLVVE